MRALATALLLAALAAPDAGAQTSSGRGASSDAERQAVMRTITGLFDAMRAGDSAAVRAAFHPNAVLMTTATRQGTPILRVDSVDAFVRAVGTPHDEVWDERIWGEQVQVDDNLAAAWMNYAFYAGEKFSHCGVNAFQLFRGADGWKIIAITDTRRREGCTPPPRD